MVKAPCYDTVNKQDCPRRQWCKEVGRSQCKEWVEYEAAHKAELELIAKDRKQRSMAYEDSQRLRKRLHRSQRY